MVEPENKSEGAGGNAAPEDLLFGDSSSSTATEAQPTPTPAETPPAEPAAPTTTNVDDLTVEDDTTAADALGDPTAADALGNEDGGEGGEGKSAPTAYEDFDIPEGVSTFGEPVVAALGEVASELDLTQEQAQKVIDKLGPAQLEAQQAVVSNVTKTWVDASRADKEVGGTNYRASLGNARRAVDRFATPEFRKLLVGKGTQLANHPEMLRFLSRVGAATSADRKIVTGKQTPTAPKVNVNDPMATQDETADLMFGTTDLHQQ